MEFLQTNLKKFICKDFRLLSEKNEAHLKEKVKAASPKSVFIQQNEHIYRVNEQDDVNHLIFSACREISIHTELATIINYFIVFKSLLVFAISRYLVYLIVS